jgi:hypothetical protein
MREPPEFIVPHSDYGDPECCGLIFAEIRGEEADLVCNECGIVIRTVAAGEADKVLLEMSLEQGFASEMCPHCGQVNLIPGFSEMIAFTCRYCGRAVDVRSGK